MVKTRLKIGQQNKIKIDQSDWPTLIFHDSYEHIFWQPINYIFGNKQIIGVNSL